MKTGKPFALAGLWDRWRSRGDPIIESFTIITTVPNELMRPLHDRMPCILQREDYYQWLDPEDSPRPPAELLRPFPPEQMRAWRIAKEIGNVRNDRPDLIQEIV